MNFAHHWVFIHAGIRAVTEIYENLGIRRGVSLSGK